MKIGSKSLVKDSSIYLFTSLAVSFVNFITLPIYTRYLLPQEYAIVALFLMFGQVSVGLVSLGLQSASYRYYFKFKDDLNKYKISILRFVIFNNYLLFCILNLQFIANWVSESFKNEISPLSHKAVFY